MEFVLHTEGMEWTDARSLSQDAKAALRRRGVMAVGVGMKQKEVARALGVSAYTVNLWMKTYRAEGEKGLAAKKKGPAKGFGKKLTVRQSSSLSLGARQTSGSNCVSRVRCGRGMRCVSW